MNRILKLSRILIWNLFALYLLQATSVRAQAIGALIGGGGDSKLVGLSIQTSEQVFTKATSNHLNVSAHIEIGLNRLEGRGMNPKGSLALALTPVLRVSNANGVTKFMEFGIGVSYFERKRLSDELTVGTHFEFGDFLGFGFKFGTRSKYELGYRFLHYSNAGISSENPGVDLHLLRFTTFIQE